MSRLAKLFAFLAALALFAIPIERRHDKIFRFVSKALTPEWLELPAWFDKKLCFYPTDIAVLLLFLIALYTQRDKIRSLLFGKGALLLWMIFIGATLSIALSPLSTYPIAYSRLLQLLIPFLFFCCLAHQSEPGELSTLLLTSLVAAAVFQSIIALTQYLEQGYLGLHFLGEPRSPTGLYYIPSGRRWIFDAFLTSPHKAPLLMRACGTMPHCNPLGGFLCLSLLSSYSLLASSIKKGARAFFFFAISLILIGICVTFSRAAIFGWILGTIVWFGYALYQKGWENIKRDPSFSRVAKAVFFASVLCALLFHEQFMFRGGVIGSTNLSQKSNQERLNFQNIAYQMIGEKPLAGWGYHQYALSAAHHLKEEKRKPMEVHNIYLLLAAETGVISAALFLLFASFLLLSSIRVPFTPQMASLISMFLAILFIGGCDLYPLFSQNGRLLLFGIAGLLAAHRKIISFSLNKEESWKMFDRISPSYDAINRILSMKMDGRWRKTVSRFLPIGRPLHILDLATGTGDQILALMEGKAHIATATGIDLSTEMVAIAKKKAEKNKNIVWQIADAAHLPFSPAHFDVTTCSFGIRNFPDPLLSLKEMHRVLKSGGRCLILEFSLPSRPFRWPYLLYLRTLLPFLGGLLSKEPAAYRYLNATIETFPSGDAFCALLQEAQFTRATAHKMALGAVTLYVGEKS